MSENFERLAGKIFEDRSEKLSDLNTKQMDAILKPLSEKILEFRNTVESAHKEETAQHRVMKEKIGDLEKLNERLHEDATNLSRALTSNVKAQGNWGEQQLERLLEVAGLQKGSGILHPVFRDHRERPAGPAGPGAAPARRQIHRARFQGFTAGLDPFPGMRRR